MAKLTMAARSMRRQKAQREIRAAKLGTATDAIGRLTPGCEIYCLTFGQFSLIDALVAVLDQTGPADVDISTWTAAHAHLDRSKELLGGAAGKGGAIRRCRWLVDTSFLNRQPAYVAHMRKLFGDDSIRTYRSHAKFVTVRNDRWNLALRTSMNLNENARLENLEISDDAELVAFLAKVVDEVFAEHAAGDFQALLSGLDGVENVPLPGNITAREIGELRKPSTGRALD